MKPSDISDHLKLNEDGIYVSGTTEKISFPEGGHDELFALEETSFWYQHRNNVISSLTNVFSPEQMLLDLGGGNGYVVKHLTAHGNPSWLMELNMEAIANAKKRGVQDLIFSSFSGAHFIPDSIPNIGLFDVLEHIKDEGAFLGEIHTALEQNGKLYITVPAYSFLWCPEDVKSGHFRRYTRKTLQKVLAKNNFKISYFSYFFTPLPLPVFLLKTVPGWFGVTPSKKKAEDYKEEHTVKNSFVNKTLQSIWDWEINRVKQLKSISFGSSCVVVAEKV